MVGNRLIITKNTAFQRKSERGNLKASFLELHLVLLGDPEIPIRIILVVARRTAKSFLGVELPGTEKSGSQTKCHSKPAY